MTRVEFSLNDSKYNHLRCKLNSNDLHILSVPKRLPCSSVACLDCIKKSFSSNSKQVCSHCNDIHSIDDVDNWETLNDIVEEIKINEEEITRELVDKLLEYADTLKGKYEERDARIDSICDNIKKKIEERVNEIKDQLEKLHQEMLDNLETIKNKVYLELGKYNEQVSLKCSEYEEFTEKMESMLSNYENNKEELQKSIYDCQSKIEDLNKLDETFKKLLRRITFEPSEWLPDVSYIGTFEGFDFDSDDDTNDT